MSKDLGYCCVALLLARVAAIVPATAQPQDPPLAGAPKGKIHTVTLAAQLPTVHGFREYVEQAA